MPVLKSGPTHLHDAVPMRLGQEFSGFAETIHFVYLQTEECLKDLHEIGLGGNNIGTKINLHPDYIPKIMGEVCQRTKLPFREPANIFKFIHSYGNFLIFLL